VTNRPKKLLDQADTDLCRSVRDATHLKHYAYSIEKTPTSTGSTDWIRQ